MDEDQRSERKRSSRDRDRNFDSDRDSHRRRDRSRSRDRDRGSHEHRRRYRDEHDDRDRHRGRWSDDDDDDDDRRWRGRDREDRPRRSKPSAPVVFLEKVPDRVLQSDIMHQLGKYAEKIRDVRVFRRGDKWDNPYKSAVIEFYERADAARWLSENKDNFTLMNEPVTVGSPQEREESSGRASGDWICFQCHKLNFSRRTHCISCDLSRRESERESGREDASDRKGAPPANVLIVRGLDLQSAEIDVVDAIADISPGLRMKDVRVIRDKGSNLSRGFCFLELSDVEEATQLLEKLTSKKHPFLVSGKRVTVDFARPSNTWNSSKNPTNSVASAAIAQAQWSHADATAAVLERVQSTAQQASQQATTSQDTSTQNKDNGLPSSYSYDASSGFYYDSNTGLYYDPKTQYHYNSQTGQYCYYDPNQLKYIPVDSEGNPVSEATTSSTDPNLGKKKKDTTSTASLVSASSVNAKKLAKNMERWAKSVNAAKSAQKQQMNILIQQEKQEATPPPAAGKLGGIPSVGIAVGTTVQVPQTTEFVGGDVAPPPKHTLPPGADTNPTHTDWDQLACLLCKRKFPSKEVLVKHQQFSDLHKQNLLKWKNPQSQGATSVQPKYRDRAQERRDLVGTQPIIPEWKRDVDREMAQGPSIPYEQPTVHGLKEDNIGNKMLTAMGWSDGQGLGKSNQGIVEPIKAEIRQGSAGLGARGSTYGYGMGDDYKSNVRAMTQARYKETL